MQIKEILGKFDGLEPLFTTPEKELEKVCAQLSKTDDLYHIKEMNKALKQLSEISAHKDLMQKMQEIADSLQKEKKSL